MRHMDFVVLVMNAIYIMGAVYFNFVEPVKKYNTCFSGM